MIITRETDYALRILRALAEGERMTAGELAQRDQVPQAFAYKIIKKLAKGGLVEIVRGAEGGCRLTADLDSATLYDVMACMEENAFVAACIAPGYVCAWREARGGQVCGVHCQLVQIQSKLDQELKAHTLRNLLFSG